MKIHSVCLSLGLLLVTSACRTVPQAQSPLVGSWAIDLPYSTMSAGHLIVKASDAGTLEGLLLMRWSSPTACSSVTCEGNRFKIVRTGYLLEGTVTGDVALGTVTSLSKTGAATSAPLPFRAVRNPPVDPTASVRQATFGEPVDLLAEGIAGFESMSAESFFGWSFKDGVLSNRVVAPDGTKLGHGANIRTKRADFYDFNLEYDVRVPEKSNSGVYLRGRYEIQTMDSYGKALDCHNMAALYGRLTPSVAAERPAGEWQHVSVTLYRRHITVRLNGQTIIDDQPVEGVTGGALDANEFVPGPIYIQGDHSNADYRNMILRPAL